MRWGLVLVLCACGPRYATLGEACEDVARAGCARLDECFGSHDASCVPMFISVCCDANPCGNPPRHPEGVARCVAAWPKHSCPASGATLVIPGVCMGVLE